MPSYKEKYEIVSLSLANMDRRVLVAELTLSTLRDRIIELERQRDEAHIESESDIFMKNQLAVALTEIEQLIYGDPQTASTFASRPTPEFIRTVTESLVNIGKVLRDSNSRAEMLLEGLEIKQGPKLLKRERREQLRKESISSIAASMSTSPQRMMSPPRKPASRPGSPFSDKSDRRGRHV